MLQRSGYMASESKILGNELYKNIVKNDDLQEIYEVILYNYSIKIFKSEYPNVYKHLEISDALRFADILSKSVHPTQSEFHKNWHRN